MNCMLNFPAKEQRQIAAKILRRFSAALKAFGFSRVKQSGRWERDGPHLREAIGVHKFTSGPDFRIHWEFVVPKPEGNDVIVACSSDRYCGPRYRYHLSYHRAEKYQDRCLTDMTRFVEDIVLPWFDKWANPEDAAKAPNSYIRDQDWPFLAALAGGD